MTFQTFTARDYLKIDIANNFGKPDGQAKKLDKCNWDERIAWFNANEKLLPSMVSKAEERPLFFAGLNAWKDAETGVASGYPISLDGCSSGLQILSCITGDRMGASICGVIDTGSREDAYERVFQHMMAALGDSITVDPKAVKKAVMTSLYGSTKQPEKAFGVGPVLDQFYRSVAELAPYVWALNEYLLEVWDSNREIYSWVMPDNFHSHNKVRTKVYDKFKFAGNQYQTERWVVGPKERGRSLCANITHSLDALGVREIVASCTMSQERKLELTKITMYSQHEDACDASQATTDNEAMVATLWKNYLMSGYLSVRILEYVDDSSVYFADRAALIELLDQLPKQSFHVLCIHDCFRVLPRYGNDIRKQYNLFLSKLAKSRMLEYLMTQVLLEPFTYEHPEPEMWREILDANYSLA